LVNGGLRRACRRISLRALNVKLSTFRFSIKPYMKKTINSLMIVVALLFAVNQYLIGLIPNAAGVASSAGPNIALSDNANESEVIAAILPKDADSVRPYKWQGQPVTLSAKTPGNGYDMLVAMNKTQLTGADEQQRFKAITRSVYHPCCNAPISACGCKHAMAAKGLVKYLLTKGYTDEQIKNEIFLWNRFWWPKHYATVAVYLNSQGTNPANVSAADWLGASLSTVKAGRQMKAALGR